MDKDTELFEKIYTIRCFEELLLDKFASGIFHGTTHTSLGQEANAVGVLDHLQEGDVVVSNHRCHGHFLAYGGEPQALFAELLGKPGGVCGGIGGSQHLHWKNFYSNGIQGGTLGMASGMALAEKRKGTSAVVIVFMGDGTLGEGIVYECLNMASLWQLPLMIVLENNRIAQTTPAQLAIAGSIPQRFEAFGIPTTAVDSSDVRVIQNLSGELINAVRAESSPQALVIDTARLASHSKGDDTRSDSELEILWRERDPVSIQEKRLSESERKLIKMKVEKQIRSAFLSAFTEKRTVQ